MVSLPAVMSKALYPAGKGPASWVAILTRLQVFRHAEHIDHVIGLGPVGKYHLVLPVAGEVGGGEPEQTATVAARRGAYGIVGDLDIEIVDIVAGHSLRVQFVKTTKWMAPLPA
jgi:hypothetical protein